jgi:rhodanese-related sulfurtransferase
MPFSLRLRPSGLALALALAGALAAAPRPAVAGEAAPTPGVVDGPTARALVAAGVRVVDVRTPAEYALGHVAGALNIPFDEIVRRAGEIGAKDAPVLLYCRSGRRSGIAADALRGLGFQRIYDLQRYDAWVASAPSAPHQ